MSLNRLWLFVAVAMPVLAAMLAPMSTVDLAYQLRAGDQILRTGAIPTADVWTYTAAGTPWFDQQWGGQVILTAVSSVGGWTGLVLLRALLTGLIFASLAFVARRRGVDPRTTALLVIGAFVVSAPALAMRPQLFGAACLAITVLVVSERHRRPRVLWLVPLVVAVWANLHGSFFLGPAVLGLTWLEDVRSGVADRHIALMAAVVSALAACLTPFGPAVWSYAVGLSSNPEVTTRITEWQPTSLRTVPGLLFFGSALAIAVYLARRGRPTPWPALAALGFFFVIGAYAERGVAWWALGAFGAIVGLFGQHDARTSRVEPSGLRRVNMTVAGALILAGIALVPLWRPTVQGTGAPIGVLSQAPPGITTALRALARPGDRVFNAQPWGSWFEYAIPTLPVAIDSRIEMFPADVWRDYEAIQAGADGWSGRLDSEQVTIVVTAGDGGTFATRLLASAWTESYRDADGRIFVRSTRQASAWVRAAAPPVLGLQATIGGR